MKFKYKITNKHFYKKNRGLVTPFNNGYEYIFSITNVVNLDSISQITKSKQDRYK